MNSEIEDRIQEARWEIAEDEGIDIMEVSDRALVYHLAEDLLFFDRKIVDDLGPSEEVDYEDIVEKDVEFHPSEATVELKEVIYKYKFVLVDPKTDKEEPWTGIFETEPAADAWFDKFGSKTKLNGKELVKIRVEYNPVTNHNERKYKRRKK